MTLAAATRRAILAADGTTREVAARLGVSAATVSSLRRANPRVSKPTHPAKYQSQKRAERRGQARSNRTEPTDSNTEFAHGPDTHTIHRPKLLRVQTDNNGQPCCPSCGRS